MDVQTADVAVATPAMAAVHDEVQTNLIFLVSFCMSPFLFEQSVFLMLYY